MGIREFDIIAPTFYLSPEPCKYLLASAARQHILPKVYGYGKPFTSWIQTHIDECLEHLRFGIDGTHVMFTDGSDVLYLKSQREIWNRYMRLGHPPMLVSIEKSGVNAGGWIGEREVAIAILEHLKTMADVPNAGDPQERWRFAIECKEISVVGDFAHHIFSVNQWPTDACVLHLAGGYSDPKTGRAERLEPIWKEIRGV